MYRSSPSAGMLRPVLSDEAGRDVLICGMKYIANITAGYVCEFVVLTEKAIVPGNYL